MRYITYLNIIAKLISTISIFIFIHKIEDYIYVPLINSLGYIIVGIIALGIIKKKITLKLQNIMNLKFYLLNSWYIFISNIAINLYTVSITFILGLFTNNTIVGYYSIAEKVINLVNSLRNIFIQVLFPYISKVYKHNKLRYLKIVKKILIYGTIVSFVLYIFICLYKDLIIKLITGEANNIIGNIINIIGLNIVITFSNVALGTLFLIAAKHDKYIVKATYIGAIFIIVCITVLFLKNDINIITIAYVNVGAELSILVYEIYLYFKLSRRIANENIRN